MINIGVEFWDEAKIIIKKPVIGISSIGGFLVSLEGDLPVGMIRLMSMPTTPKLASDHLKSTMDMQSTHTFINPQAKTVRELYDITIGHGHSSMW